MTETFKKQIDKYLKKISSIKFKRKLKKEKSKLYITDSNDGSFVSKRNKFKFFKNKLEFQNTFQEIKNIHTYYYVFWTFLLLSSMYILFFSHYFSIKNIDIIRQDDIINIDLSYRSIENIRYKPILIEDKEKMRDNLINHQPNIKEIYIRKILPDNIKIIISSYPTHFFFEKDGKNYLITENGVVVWGKPKKDLIKINVKDIDNIWILDYKKIFKDDYIARMKDIISKIQERNSFVQINEINYYKKEAELHITTKENTIIIFDLNKEINIQIEKLNVFYKEYIKKIKLWIVYIDLRVNEKIYYCTKENEFQCNVNLKNIYN